MRGYLALFMMRFKQLLQYRRAALAGIATQVFWGIIKLWVLQAFYSMTDAPQPLTFVQGATFIWIGQALIQMLPWNFDRELEVKIRDGSIAYELLRPLHLYGLIFSRAIALRIAPTLLRIAPVVLLGWFFFDLALPVSLQAGFYFLIAVILGCLLSSAITALVGISLFWTLSSEGIQRLIPQLTILLTGMIVPIPLFPDWMKPALLMQPFRGIIDIPIRIYTGMIPLEGVPEAFLFQISWFLAALGIGLFLVRRATKQIVLEGG